MVTLFCAIVGVVGDAFAVNIDAVETVGDLKEAIKKVRGLKDFDAKNLQLFLAKKDGAWLPDDKALDVLLQSKLDASLYTKLCSSWRLDSQPSSGQTFHLERKSCMCWWCRVKQHHKPACSVDDRRK
ncbi:hypothetical protein PF010_g5521 [Phytophthora fragariae]|uniref:Crinkler effector protein N-terminal domain-containing protein n=1 Tax=Phytophthora fragariae TaxID=53985 RepID=A0A6A3LQX7_9STRA|nr:hypothetical protein PF003_g27685 [Phytophthora fragariae]KAE8943182.1 hypothetical protein PF009_g7077 [Phytophthora fragariae]KAE9020565.1 hypothetical protein PF011_g5354 [Phytophthora fragariae]KAE9125740.1 hypothetical protein PF010_g5521 [Phytophthora fragariae]KAE9133060.1 hypothetical protein PF007_g3499 [Phytophthora fragariae]